MDSAKTSQGKNDEDSRTISGDSIRSRSSTLCPSEDKPIRFERTSVTTVVNDEPQELFIETWVDIPRKLQFGPPAESSNFELSIFSAVDFEVEDKTVIICWTQQHVLRHPIDMKEVSQDHLKPFVTTLTHEGLDSKDSRNVIQALEVMHCRIAGIYIGHHQHWLPTWGPIWQKQIDQPLPVPESDSWSRNLLSKESSGRNKLLDRLRGAFGGDLATAVESHLPGLWFNLKTPRKFKT
ncbi:hypothetical protein TREMEDRAFT_60864 [Tremella mesenterica DSM 1558]|uniref:uncharacterized protein n=1 Tax=Tremella mesenterica (strain ATCC 24925 / CBS 8224 / DSM 1558 / NBRC 9311 / NRRL Y-6157 / RJB 2259-6 / UBC 559-6) TaxID=578456 RepID=UPI0003F49BE1|nr:uncharacterized protein TREMEDRAFT_60864 [Tremella mesenterica DSM 1558]EIW70371.1 hypothetical protein TREMEDRAFT_60864 [Tremella mesenterica DSM 1558]